METDIDESQDDDKRPAKKPRMLQRHHAVRKLFDSDSEKEVVCRVNFGCAALKVLTSIF